MAKWSRREVFGAGAAGLATLYLPNLALGGSKGSARKPRNVIFCVSDGMSAGVPSMLDQFLSAVHGRPSFWRRLLQDPRTVQTVQETCSLSSLVTDSSAASSAWGSGRRIVNGQVNCYPDGTRLTPLYEVLKDRVKVATGLVTTATITHATPAGFAVSHPTRDEEARIAEKYLAAQVDVLFGGGDRFFSGSTRPDRKNLYAEFAKSGYRVVRDKASLLALKPGRKALGVFSASHVPYEVDRLNQKDLLESVPSLKEMALKAVEMLEGSPNGFILQVEAARVDHAAHGNDPAGVLYDQLAFDEAVEAIVAWADKRGDTLVLVTSDHGNSNPGLMGAGDEYFDSTAGLEKLAQAKASFSALLAQIGSQPTGDSIREAVREHLGIGLTDKEGDLVARAARRESDLQTVELYSGASSALALVVSNHYHIGWSGPSHSSDWVPLLALGPGSREFAKGWMANSAVFDALLKVYGVRFENPPQMSREDMLRHLGKRREALRRAIDGHWLA